MKNSTLCGLLSIPLFIGSASATGLPADLTSLTATEAATLICEKKVTSETLVKAWLTRTEANPNLNAFITINGARALTQAKAYDARLAAHLPCLPIGGVPIGVKDNMQVIGFPNTAGTPALRHFMPQTTAPVVQKLQAAGAIVLGKTNMQELAYGSTGYNTAYHVADVIGVRNAWNHAKIPGGSSSGSAVAVSARMVPAALGTDTGGSVRGPCAFNGCVAFRPTVGRYSQEGITPISHTRDTAGPMANSVNDIALMDQIITGAKILPPAATKTITLGVPDYFWADLSPEVMVKSDQVLARLKSAGINIVPVQMPDLKERIAAVSMPIVIYEGKHDLVTWLAQNHTGITFDEVAAKVSMPEVKEIVDRYIAPQTLPDASGNMVSVETLYQSAIKTGLPALKQAYQQVFEQHHLDALIFPTTPDVAIDTGPHAGTPEFFARSIRNTDPGSNIRLPGLTLPAGLGEKSQLPIGIEIDGLPNTDSKILAIGKTIESILGRASAPQI